MNALAGAHDAAVQMIDTSIVRVHQHGACITRNRRQVHGPVTGRVDQQDSCGCRYQRATGAARTDSRRRARQPRRAWANIPPRGNRNEPICFSPQLYRARNLVERFFNKIQAMSADRNTLRQARARVTSSCRGHGPAASHNLHHPASHRLGKTPLPKFRLRCRSPWGLRQTGYCPGQPARGHLCHPYRLWGLVRPQGQQRRQGP
jgi:transposase